MYHTMSLLLRYCMLAVVMHHANAHRHLVTASMVLWLSFRASNVPTAHHHDAFIACLQKRVTIMPVRCHTSSTCVALSLCVSSGLACTSAEISTRRLVQRLPCSAHHPSPSASRALGRRSHQRPRLLIEDSRRRVAEGRPAGASHSGRARLERNPGSLVCHLRCSLSTPPPLHKGNHIVLLCAA